MKKQQMFDWEKETWKQIPGFADIYEISSWGRVRNRKTGRIKRPWMAPSRDGNTYLKITLHRRQTRFKYLLHRLVAAVFYRDLLNVELDEQVHHKDRNRHNNRLDNLEIMKTTEHLSVHARLDEDF